MLGNQLSSLKAIHKVFDTLSKKSGAGRKGEGITLSPIQCENFKCAYPKAHGLSMTVSGSLVCITFPFLRVINRIVPDMDNRATPFKGRGSAGTNNVEDPMAALLDERDDENDIEGVPLDEDETSFSPFPPASSVVSTPVSGPYASLSNLASPMPTSSPALSRGHTLVGWSPHRRPSTVSQRSLSSLRGSCSVPRVGKD